MRKKRTKKMDVMRVCFRTETNVVVPAGEETFLVRILNPNGETMASDEYGRWVGNVTRCSFLVLPAFHQTGLFYVVCGLLAVLSAFGLHWLRVAHLHRREKDLSRRIEMEMAKVKRLQGLLPICASCKKIRSDDGYWQQIETYVDRHSDATFSHGICPSCSTELFSDLKISPPPEASGSAGSVEQPKWERASGLRTK